MIPITVSANGREELARRLHRIFIADLDTGQPPPHESMLRFADELLAEDYTDERYGPRIGDGGPAMAFVAVGPSS